MSSCGSCGTTENGVPKGCQSHGTCGTDGCNKLTVFDWLANIDTLSSTKTQLVEVKFKNDRKAIYLNSANLPLHIGDIVAVEASPGHDVGIISLVGALVQIQFEKKKQNPDEVNKIYRIANQKDIDTWQDFRKKENEMMIKARKIARDLGLSMKICDVEFQGDGTKATFYYTAEGRIDFRELIKQFAGNFRTKIDMRQIGYRQESSKVGGIGSCGRELCCSSWLTDFRSVNTAAARFQQLSINPTKLAGQCGKLKCCLNFELDSYLEAISDFPSQNTVLKTEKGNAHCLKIDVFRKKMWFIYSDNTLNWYDFQIDEVKNFIDQNKSGQILPSLEDLKKNTSIVQVVDLIQEDSINRFENKNKNKRNKKKNQQNTTLNKVANTQNNPVESSQKLVKKINPNNKIVANKQKTNPLNEKVKQEKNQANEIKQEVNHTSNKQNVAQHKSNHSKNTHFNKKKIVTKGKPTPPNNTTSNENTN